MVGMMSYRCDNCGSRNHTVFDCSKEYNGWREREPKVDPEEYHVAEVHEDESLEKTASKNNSLVELLGHDPLKEPFLRESTRQAIEESKKSMGVVEVIELPKAEVKAEREIMLPRAEKPERKAKSKKKTEVNQGSLF